MKAERIPSEPADTPATTPPEVGPSVPVPPREPGAVEIRGPLPGESWLDEMRADREYTEGWRAGVWGTPSPAPPSPFYRLGAEDAQRTTRRGVHGYRRP